MKRQMILSALVGFALPVALMLATWALPDLRLADQLIDYLRPAIDLPSILRVQPG